MIPHAEQSTRPHHDTPEKRQQREALLWDERLTVDEKKFFLRRVAAERDVPPYNWSRYYTHAWVDFTPDEQRRIIRAIHIHCTSFYDIARFLDGHD